MCHYVVSLCRCAQVSKAWNVLALDGSNWQKVDLFEFQIDIEGIVVENIARRCGGFLRKLSLKGCQAVGDSALATFSQYCNNIELLNLKYCKKISDRTSQSLSMHCHKLQYLDVSSCSAVTDISLHALSQGCPNLVHLGKYFLPPFLFESYFVGYQQIMLFSGDDMFYILYWKQISVGVT